MVFKCQEDSFLKEFNSKVVTCEKLASKDEENYEIILEDTILFPEGGGQVNLLNKKLTYQYIFTSFYHLTIQNFILNL